ncbi:hypothetical protein SCLCIDRAFT_1213719 [Scleroderma citrinum Foug A]|uniref:Peptide hydrolase n=1 Tax=Scleroderma citrinum Foug A TaxID=1036808 RepID=A0A0C3DTH0_9AGAM|nr:hypothetical protein SCLCIDRAFT_1213719 [Scleroderma citrinum Foug A]
MRILDRIPAVLAFRTVPTTVALVVVYAAIFISVLLTDQIPSIPKHTRGLDLDQAYLDLHQVSARPHPFNSHANDIVRDYILGRISNVASRYPHVEIFDDTVSNASWATKPIGVYFEGNNILVKVEGTDPEYRDSGGVLLSAHFDSVSTAPGTTDNGMGVVTAIQMVEYFAKHRPKRTVVFNINNAEEEGLYGAHAFLEHPWFSISDVFLNLEGAAAGGRPLLFRATSAIPLQSWSGAYVPHPHANVLSADSFSRGVVRSATDFSVYALAGLEGLDFAFYRGRSRYHTKYDSIPGMTGGKKALWAMMENTHGASIALANRDNFHVHPSGQRDRPVYFDLFGSALVLFSLEGLFIMNVVLLTAGPITLLLLMYSQRIIKATKWIRQRRQEAANGGEVHEPWEIRALQILKCIGKALWRSASFWVALLVSAGLQVALVALYVKINPFVIHSHPYLVLISVLSLAYLSTVLVFSIPLPKGGVAPTPEQRKLEIFLQVYIFTWLALVLSTVLLRKTGIGGTYLFSFWNAAVLLGCILACIEVTAYPLLGVSSSERTGYEAVPTEEVGDGEEALRDVDVAEPSETTPLLRASREDSPFPDRSWWAVDWWILQLLVSVPFPVILFFHVVVMVLGGQSQTLADGINPSVVYAMVSVLALLIILPMAPFATNVHRLLTFIVLVVFILSTLYTWLAFPFTEQDPLKIYFSQTVDLESSNTHVERVTTALTGPRQYLQSHILSHLPSAYNAPVACYDAPDKLGLQTCKWEVGNDMAPSPGGNEWDEDAWVSTSVFRTGEHRARITVRGRNTRNCYIEVGNRKITQFAVLGDGVKGLQTGYEIPDGGLDTIRLWSRDFGKEFEVDMAWKGSGDTVPIGEVSGRISCGWVEYESGTVGGGRTGGRIPSLEEVIAFLPEWAVVSKSASALFDAGFYFQA